MALYEDRVMCYYKMRDIEKQIDDNPELAKDMVQWHERHVLAQYELESYQRDKAFLYKHPITEQHSLEQRLERMRKLDPAGFADELAKAKEYIKRYRSYLNRSDLTHGQRTKYTEHITLYNQKLKIMTVLLSQ